MTCTYVGAGSGEFNIKWQKRRKISQNDEKGAEIGT